MCACTTTPCWRITLEQKYPDHKGWHGSCLHNKRCVYCIWDKQNCTIVHSSSCCRAATWLVFLLQWNGSSRNGAYVPTEKTHYATCVEEDLFPLCVNWVKDWISMRRQSQIFSIDQLNCIPCTDSGHSLSKTPPAEPSVRHTLTPNLVAASLFSRFTHLFHKFWYCSCSDPFCQTIF